MKICIVTPRFPYPENGGDVVLINDIIHYLSDKGNEIILLSYYEKEQIGLINQNYEHIKQIIPIKRKKIISIFWSIIFFITRRPIQCGYYYSKAMKKKIKSINKSIKPDLYVCHLLRMLPYFDELQINKNVIVQMSDVLSKTYALSKKSAGSFLKKLIYTFEEKPIKRYEIQTVNTYPKTVLVSEQDKSYFANNPAVYYHNNGIRKIVNNQHYDRNKIVFVGNMRTLQNVDGCLHFVKNIFPIIKNNNPNAILYIVGSSPNDNIKELESDSIHVTGFVESVEEFIKDAVLSVAPIRVAAGIQNKVLISMACNVPVVLSSLISKGIPQLENGVNCFIEDDANKFAKKCISIMNNHELHDSIAKAAIDMVERNYYWNIHLNNYEVLP